MSNIEDFEQYLRYNLKISVSGLQMSIMILWSKVHLVHHYVLIAVLLYNFIGQISMSKIPSETQDQLNYESLQNYKKMMYLEVIIVQDIHFHCRFVQK